MDKLAFAPLIDLPLVGVMLAGFLLHFNQWVQRDDIDTSVDLVPRLPNARFRVVAFFACLSLFCWFINLSVWSIVALLLGCGVAVALVFGGNVDGGGFGLGAAAYLVREWSFGFPQLVLHPPACEGHDAESETDRDGLLGKSGVTTSPVRPTGDAEFDGVTCTVTSDSGQLLDAGTAVTVTSVRNGRLCITPTSEVHKRGGSHGHEAS